MLKSVCINPVMMKTLSYCGHGDKILIADANYPVEFNTGEAKKIYLGVRSGLPTATDVLEVLAQTVPIERAEVMVPEDSPEPEIFADFRRITDLELDTCGRFEFYDRAKESSVCLAILTGESRTFSNILITVGVV